MKERKLKEIRKSENDTMNDRRKIAKKYRIEIGVLKKYIKKWPFFFPPLSSDN